MEAPIISREVVDAEVRAALAATLRKEPESIDMSASIVKGLGATSIDFLDINFRLESTFGIQLATQVLLDHVEEQVGEGLAIDSDGKVTAPAAELLRLYFGELDGLDAGMDANTISALVTPKIVADGVERILDELPASCACGASEWKSEDGRTVACGACGADAEYTDGDDLLEAWIRGVQAERKLFPSA